MHTIVLEPGGVYHTHRGGVAHDDLMGTDGSGRLVVRWAPSTWRFGLLADYVLSMPRGAQVIYPKDAAQIVAMGDIFPGARSSRPAQASGALSCSLLRAVGSSGAVTLGVAGRLPAVARRNVERSSAARIRPGRCAWRRRRHQRGRYDRIILDMLAPWEMIDLLERLSSRRRLRRLCGHHAPVVRVGGGSAGNGGSPNRGRGIPGPGLACGGLAVRPDHA